MVPDQLSTIIELQCRLTLGWLDPNQKEEHRSLPARNALRKKEKKSDISAFGRVILFILLTKNQFLTWLFVPIKDHKRILSLQNLTNPVLNPISMIWKRIVQTLNLSTNFDQSLVLISQMTSMTDRVSLESARKLFNRLRKDSKIKLSRTLVSRIDMIINNELSSDMQVYVTELCDLRLVTTHY